MVEVLHELREAADVQVGVVVGPREAVAVNVSLGVAGVLDIARAADVLQSRERGRGAECTHHVSRRKKKRRHQTHATHLDRKNTHRQASREVECRRRCHFRDNKLADVSAGGTTKTTGM